MSEGKAGGLKAQTALPVTPAMQDSIERQFAMLTDGMQASFGRAEQFPLDYGDHGHTREREFDIAIRLSKSTAELLLAMAKVRGEFSHNYNIQRGNAAPPPPPSDS